MTKHLPLGFAICLLLATACNKGFSEKDLVGRWTRDPQAHNGSTNPEVERQMYITVAADHKFGLHTPTPAGFEGSWSYDEDHNEIVLTPETLVITNPGQPGQPTRQPISQALATMRANNAPPNMINSLSAISRQMRLRPSDDGKKLMSNGAPEFVKAEG